MALRFLPGPDYRAIPRDPTPWVIEKLVTVGGLTNIYGKPKTHKSYLALGMCYAIANGEATWEGFPVLKHGRVAYLQIDNPPSEWNDRLQRIHNAGYSDRNVWFCDMDMAPYPYNVLNSEHLQQLKTALDSVQPVMVVIDTLRDAFDGDENDSNTMRNVITKLVSVCKPAAVILISHARKDSLFAKDSTQEEDIMDGNRGSGALPGKMDVVIRLTDKTMTFKGRASKQTRVNVTHDELNMVHVEQDTEISGRHQVVRRIVNEHPLLGKNAIEKLIAEQAGVSSKTAERDLDQLFPGRWARAAKAA